MKFWYTVAVVIWLISGAGEGQKDRIQEQLTEVAQEIDNLIEENKIPIYLLGEYVLTMPASRAMGGELMEPDMWNTDEIQKIAECIEGKWLIDEYIAMVLPRGMGDQTEYVLQREEYFQNNIPDTIYVISEEFKYTNPHIYLFAGTAYSFNSGFGFSYKMQAKTPVVGIAGKTTTITNGEESEEGFWFFLDASGRIFQYDNEAVYSLKRIE